MNRKALFQTLVEKINISLSDLQIEQFLLYYEMIIEKNKVMNLTGITDYEEVLVKHFIDSLSIIKVYDLNRESKILDMGTGAGFPGIPIKIAFPNTKVVLLDSLNKRVSFLNDVIKKLDLKNISAIHGRAEDYGKNLEYREKFDLCVSRAVAKLSTLCEYCVPYIKVNGCFISYKAGNMEQELEESQKAIRVLGGSLEEVINFKLPETNIDRSFIVIKKIGITPKIYPRSFGKPAKEPISG